MAAIIVNGIITRYSVDPFGRVYSHISEKFLRPTIDSDGYEIVSICFLPGKIKKCKVHRLVAEYFLKPLAGKTQVNHINNIRNDNRVENLEWTTVFGNVEHRTVQNRTAKHYGEKSGTAKLTTKEVLEIRKCYPAKNYTTLAKEYGVSKSQITRIIKRQRWSHLQ
jgi:hypothetical protein